MGDGKVARRGAWRIRPGLKVSSPGEGEEIGLTLGKAADRDTKESQTSQLVGEANWE